MENNNKIDICSKNLDELKEILVSIDEKPFRAKQIYIWLHKKLVKNFEDMTDISKSLRKKLEDKFFISHISIEKKLVSNNDGTEKYLFQLENKTLVESVLMSYSYGNTVCVSTQSGCKMGCKFCASTLNGFDRNLTTSEILSQVYEIQRNINDRISNIVLMGSGEPMDNYDNVIKFIKIINSEEGLNIGQRHITLSTCGIVPKIYKFADENLQSTLAISLHAPNDIIRKQTMPIANVYSIREILDACKYYNEKTNKRVTFEYALIKDLNDSEKHAQELGMLLKNTLSHVNLIPINDVKERNYIKSSKDRILKFASILENFNIETTVRRKLGSDINSACGQLRKLYK